ncbi:MAG: hypothetical protein NZ550_05735 [Fimbriimonadales bacterium]|nr:hypothetical protein [Fimbriimonadales bacterium]
MRTWFLLWSATLLLLVAAGGGCLYVLLRPSPEVVRKADGLMHALHTHDLRGIKAVACSDEVAARIAYGWHLLEHTLGRMKRYRFVQVRRVLMMGAADEREGSLRYPVFEVEYEVEFARSSAETIVVTFRCEGEACCAQTVAWWRRP